jgi:hypothetical protein
VVAALGVPQDEALDEKGAPIDTYAEARQKLAGGAKTTMAKYIKDALKIRKRLPGRHDFPLLVETPHDDFCVARGNIVVALKVVLNIIRPHEVHNVSAPDIVADIV